MGRPRDCNTTSETSASIQTRSERVPVPSFDLGLLAGGQYHDWLVLGLFLSLPLGAVIALARLAPSPWLPAVGTAYVETIRNIPLLAHLLFWYFGAPELLPAAWKEWLYAGNIEFYAAVVALTLFTAAYM